MPSYLDSAAGTGTAATTTVVVSMPTDRPDGALGLVAVSIYDPADTRFLATPDGWTLVSSELDPTRDNNWYLFGRFLDSQAATLEIEQTVGSWWVAYSTITVADYEGTIDSIGVSKAADTDGGLTVAIPETTVQNDDLSLIYVLGRSSTQSAGAPPSGWTERADQKQAAVDTAVQAATRNAQTAATLSGLAYTFTGAIPKAWGVAVTVPAAVPGYPTNRRRRR